MSDTRFGGFPEILEGQVALKSDPYEQVDKNNTRTWRVSVSVTLFMFSGC